MTKVETRNLSGLDKDQLLHLVNALILADNGLFEEPVDLALCVRADGLKPSMRDRTSVLIYLMSEEPQDTLRIEAIQEKSRYPVEVIDGLLAITFTPNMNDHLENLHKMINVFNGTCK